MVTNDQMMVWHHARANATERGRQIAIVTGQRRISFADLAEMAESLAAAMHARGIRRADVVSYQLPNWHEAIVIVLAILRIGAVANPIMTTYRRHELRQILNDTRSRMLFIPVMLRKTDHVALAGEIDAPNLELLVTVRDIAPACLDYESLVCDGKRLTRAPEPATTPDDLALIMYTSGTSGTPKGAKHSQRTLIGDSVSSIRFAGVAEGDANLVVSPITHITGMNHAVFVPQINRTKMVLLDEWNPGAAARLIAAEKCVWMAGATPFLHGLLHDPEAAPKDIASLRVFRCGGASVPPGLVRAAALRGIEVARCYGCTEMPTISGITPGDLERNATTDGRVHDEVEVRIVALDDESHILPAGTPGEIQARGPELFLGYLDPDQTAEAMTADGFFRTGDIGILDTDRFISIIGRRKDIIIRKGENISAREIEDVLSEHPDIDAVAVIGLPDETRGEMVVAVCVTRQPGLRLQHIVDYLDQHGLARQKFPERLETVDELPMTAGGKVVKVDLCRRFSLRRSSER